MNRKTLKKQTHNTVSESYNTALTFNNNTNNITKTHTYEKAISVAPFLQENQTVKIWPIL
jgi:hypothetical protein